MSCAHSRGGNYTGRVDQGVGSLGAILDFCLPHSASFPQTRTWQLASPRVRNPRASKEEATRPFMTSSYKSCAIILATFYSLEVSL